MIKNTVIVFFSLFGAVGYSQSLSLSYFGIPFKNPYLQVKWNVSSNALPPKVWVYELEPNPFSRDVITNVMKLTGFTEKDKMHDGTNAIVFDDAKEGRRLSFYYPWGWIRYKSNGTNRGPRMFEGEPDEIKLKQTALKIISELGIKDFELDKNPTNAKPDLRYFHGESVSYINHVFVTNIYDRAIGFRRAVDGISYMGFDSGGQGRITFGEHGGITKMDVYWRHLKPFKSYPAATPEMIIKWMREGKGVQNGILMSELPIDWPTVKSVTVNEAYVVCYGGTPMQRSNWLIPLVALGTTVERDNGRTVNVEIDCPIYEDETSPKHP